MFTMGRIRGVLILLALAVLVGAAGATSYIQLFVHPGSGTVCVDDYCQVNVGTLEGYSSTQFQDVTCGRDHDIRVYDTAGYEDYSDSVYMDYNCDSVTSRIYLEPVLRETPLPGTGDIQVYISPGIGQVCRDDIECETSTGPVTDTWSVRFSDVPADGSHTISVTAAGYRSYSRQVSVQPGGVTGVTISLVPAGVPEAPPATQSPACVMVPFSAAVISGIVLVYRRAGR